MCEPIDFETPATYQEVADAVQDASGRKLTPNAIRMRAARNGWPVEYDIDGLARIPFAVLYRWNQLVASLIVDRRRTRYETALEAQRIPTGAMGVAA